MAPISPDELRAASRRGWERAAPGWGRRAEQGDWAMQVSVAMIDAIAPQPGQRLLELAAGPGDTGFMAAELIAPGGTLICSDGAEAMVAVARHRAQRAGIANVEFRQLELEWIDLPTASVDAVLCRWGLMLTVDPDAAAREVRRVLRPGGRVALAVWAEPERNPWATIPSRALIELGHLPAPEPGAPGPFSLSAPGRLEALLQDAGFTEVAVAPVSVPRDWTRVADFVAETAEVSPSVGPVFAALDEPERAAVNERIGEAAQPFAARDGSLRLPGTALVGSATA